ncbi:MAG: DUF6962 family protein [Gammaproteobacteria bacterium]
MEFIDNPTEQTTAITDLILAALSLSSALYLRRYRIADPWKVNLWAWAFALLSLASGLGAAAHGITLSLTAIRLLWPPITIALGLTIALFVVGAVYDLSGRGVARRLLRLMIGVGVAFFAINQIVTGTFRVLLIYEGVAMLVALIIYARIASRHSLPGAALMVAGTLITLIAAAFQNNHAIELVLIWRFDHNGVFHLIQMIGVLALVTGLRAALLAQLARIGVVLGGSQSGSRGC